MFPLLLHFYNARQTLPLQQTRSTHGQKHFHAFQILYKAILVLPVSFNSELAGGWGHRQRTSKGVYSFRTLTGMYIYTCIGLL